MIQSLSYTEMNHAVPGSTFNTRMERHIECEVPSPSQWSDSCRSPPSLHSPIHLSAELEKLKEEPYSPLSSSHLQYTAHLMSKETANEASINLAELLAENSALVQTAQQHQPQQQHQFPQPLHQQESFQQPLKVDCGDQPPFGDDFLDSLVEVKKEYDDPGYYASTSSVVVTSASSCSLQRQAPVSPPPPPTPSIQPALSLGDRLRTVELMALEHWRKDVQNISTQLNIPKDPTAWSVDNVRSWLEFEAEQQGLPAPAVDCWNLTGMDLIRLSESQFRNLIPHGGLLYAKLEVWLEALRSSHQVEIPVSSAPPLQTILSTHPSSQPQPQPQLATHPSQTQLQPQPHSYQQYQPLLSPVASADQPLSVHVPPQGVPLYYSLSAPQMYQHPQPHVAVPMFSPPGPTPVMLSPSASVPSSTVQLSPTSSQCKAPPSPSLQLPKPVIQAGRQQQMKHKSTELSSLVPSKKARVQSPTHQIQNPFLEEACLDMTSLLQQSGAASKSQSSPKQTAADTSKDTAESGDEAEEPAASGPSGRGGTHIHLWQFLKELLVRPQLYAPYIRWLDRQAGIFKIEDSTRVARLWGERKNRPAMNYDKLSRSIRQYYKKGIMKKTERSQRLVYQFCHPYGS